MQGIHGSDAIVGAELRRLPRPFEFPKVVVGIGNLGLVLLGHTSNFLIMSGDPWLHADYRQVRVIAKQRCQRPMGQYPVAARDSMTACANCAAIPPPFLPSPTHMISQRVRSQVSSAKTLLNLPQGHICDYREFHAVSSREAPMFGRTRSSASSHAALYAYGNPRGGRIS